MEKSLDLQNTQNNQAFESQLNENKTPLVSVSVPEQNSIEDGVINSTTNQNESLKSISINTNLDLKLKKTKFQEGVSTGGFAGLKNCFSPGS